jgi:hypothetical protein
MISNADTDADSDPDIEDSSRLAAKSQATHGSPERRSFPGSRGKNRGLRSGIKARSLQDSKIFQDL